MGSTSGWCLSKKNAITKLIADDFCETTLAPNADDIRHSGNISLSVLTSLKNTGLLGLLIPKKFGGLEGDCLDRLLSVQQISSCVPDVGALLQIAQLGTGSLLEFGSSQQQAQWLPALARGERICTLSITEEHSGSHVLGMRSNYRETDQGFILSGEKWFIGNAPISNLHVVYARSIERENEYSAFIIEGEREGVNNQLRQETLGLKAFPFGRVRFTNVEIPKINLVGSLGEGKKIAYQVIARHGRPSLTSLALGIHERVLLITLAFGKARKLYGKSLDQIPEVRDKIYKIYSSFESSKQLSYRAAYLAATNQDSFRAFAMAKRAAGDNCCEAALIASEIFGARAGLSQYEIGQLLLDALMTRPPSGTSDVQRKRTLESLIDGKVPSWEGQGVSDLH